MTERSTTPDGPEQLCGQTDLGDATADGAATQRPPRRFGVSAAAVATGLVLGGMGVAGLAGASTSETTPSSGATPSAQATPDPDRGVGRHGPGGRHGGGGHLGGIDGRPVHGEIVVETDDGFVTVQTQRGEVTAVGDSSITVRSVDGFTGTYAIADDTTFGRHSDGVDDIDEGDTVHVVGTEDDGTLTALSVHGGDRGWGPGGPGGRTGGDESAAPGAAA